MSVQEKAEDQRTDLSQLVTEITYEDAKRLEYIYGELAPDLEGALREWGLDFRTLPECMYEVRALSTSERELLLGRLSRKYPGQPRVYSVPVQRTVFESGTATFISTAPPSLLDVDWQERVYCWDEEDESYSYSTPTEIRCVGSDEPSKEDENDV
jgi:hypothetical protein